MAELLKPGTVKAMARELYGYDLTDEAAQVLANTTGALISSSRMLEGLQLAELEPPFGYETLIAEARRLRRR